MIMHIHIAARQMFGAVIRTVSTYKGNVLRSDGEAFILLVLERTAGTLVWPGGGMTVIRPMIAGLTLTLVLALGGCMSVRSPAFVEAASQDLAEPSPEEPAPSVSDNEPSIFSQPDISIARRQELGDQYAEQVRKRTTRSTNKALEKKLQEVVNRISKHIEGDQFEYRVYLLEDLRPNAFTTGGGHLFVTTGLIAVLRSEGQVAAVMAHEMAHNASAHVVKGAHSRAIAKRTATFSENVMHQRWGVPWLGNSLTFLVSTSVNKYTRKQEDEADALGLDYIVAAGYDPHEAPNAVKALSSDNSDQSEVKNFFFGRHSTAKARIWQFGNLIKARYAHVNPADRIRSTSEYDALAEPYWRSEQVNAGAPGQH